MDFQGKNILILGLAREGVSLARFLAQRGGDVTVTDMAPTESLQDRIRAVGSQSVHFVLGGHHPDLVNGAHVFFVSPGVPESNPVYQAALDAGLQIQSMTTLFFDLHPGVIVGITGSSGKTTTTTLVGHILSAAGRDVVVGGNTGEPMLDLLPRIGTNSVVVLELSSFQLSILRKSPNIAVVTNISPNHLDRHGNMSNYIDAKRHIVEYQNETDYAVLNADDLQARCFAESTPANIRLFGKNISSYPGATEKHDWVGLQRERFYPVMATGQIPLLGRHNVSNVLAAVAVAGVLNVATGAIAAAIRTFRSVPHRLQTIAEVAGVRYVDDSIATSPARATVALEAFDGPVLLIAGGRDKKLPWGDFAALLARKARALFLIGEAASLIEEVVQEHAGQPGTSLCRQAIFRCPTLEHAVAQASTLAQPGDIVLLSPACASYDMFADFEERGRVFSRAVEALDAA